MLGDNRKRLILIDDHVLVRQGLERLLNQGDKFVVCEETGDAASGVELVRELRPDGVIVDACLRNGTDRIDLTKKLLREFPAIVVLILSAHDDPNYIPPRGESRRDGLRGQEGSVGNAPSGAPQCFQWNTNV
jgi:DNA-binding NarL/FixJ family response regulator